MISSNFQTFQSHSFATVGLSGLVSLYFSERRGSPVSLVVFDVKYGGDGQEGGLERCRLNQPGQVEREQDSRGQQDGWQEETPDRPATSTSELDFFLRSL